MKTAEQNAAVVRRVIEEIWNDGRVEVADALFTLEYVNHNGLITDLVRGPEAIKVSVTLHRAAFPNLYVMVEGLVADGDAVALRWRACNAPLDGSPSSTALDPHCSFAGMTYSLLAGGKIAETWTYWESESVLEHLGVPKTGVDW